MKRSICALLLSLAMLLSVAGPTLFVTAVSDETNFTYTVTNGTATVTKYVGSETQVEVPSTLGGYPVTAIGKECFKDKRSLTSVTLPDGVVSIANYAFEGCEALTEIYLPSTLTSIGSLVFNQCFALEEITLPASLSSLGTSLFMECSSLSNIYVEDGSTTYQSVEGVLFSADKKELVYYPVGNSRTSYQVPAGTDSIGSNAFSTARKLTQITLPAGLTTISKNAFSYSTGLTGLFLPDGITTIGFQAFDGCSALKYVVFPSSCTSIGGSSDTIEFSIFKGVKSVVVIAPADSVAAEYAESHQFSFETEQFSDVEATIAAIGSVTLSKKADIEAARAAYMVLSAVQKSLVSNYDTLVKAEEALTVLLNGSGDLNVDGAISVSDVIILRQLILSEKWNSVGDLNQDGKLTVTDVVLLRNTILATQ